MLTTPDQRGFTLLELLITLTLLVIVAGLALPSLGTLVDDNQLRSARQTLTRAVAFTRSEAIRRGSRVVLCLSGPSAACNSPNPTRLQIVSDPGKSGAPSSSAIVLKSIALDYGSITTTYNRSFLAFTATGYASGTNGTFTLCHSNGDGAMVIVSTLGRTRAAVDYDGDGRVEKTPGHPVNCG